MICLDSTFLIDFLDSSRVAHDAAREWMSRHSDEPMYAPDFARWEVLRGAARRDGVSGVEELLSELSWLEPLPFTTAAATEAALIEAELRERGGEISTGDYPIAGTVRDAGGTLVTSDPHFEQVDGLEVVRYDVSG